MVDGNENGNIRMVEGLKRRSDPLSYSALPASKMGETADGSFLTIHGG